MPGATLAAPIMCETAASLATIAATSLIHGQMANVGIIDGTHVIRPGSYRFNSASTSPNNNQSQLIIAPTTGVGAGRWVRADPFVDLILPISSANTDGQSLITMPAELCFIPFYNGIVNEVVTAWAGGAGSRIGLSMSNGTLNSAAGNFMGSSAGVAGGNYVTYFYPALGDQFTLPTGITAYPVLCAGAQVFFNRIVSAYTSGSSRVHIACSNINGQITPVTPP